MTDLCHLLPFPSPPLGDADSRYPDADPNLPRRRIHYPRRLRARSKHRLTISRWGATAACRTEDV